MLASKGGSKGLSKGSLDQFMRVIRGFMRVIRGGVLVHELRQLVHDLTRD
jgi:hypothetical protein